MPQDQMFNWHHNSSSRSVAARILAVKQTLPKLISKHMKHWYSPGISYLYAQQAKSKSNPQNHFIRPGKTFCQ